jgi:glycosyltransferase involved in cell wall biosynthesis
VNRSRGEGRTNPDPKFVVHVCTIGIVPRLFLIDHFRRQRVAGFEVVLMCCEDQDSRFAAEASGARLIPVGIKQGFAPLSDLLALFRLWRTLRVLRPAIVDSHCTKAGFIGALASRLARVPIRIYHNHGMVLLSATGMTRAVFRFVESVACKLSTRVIYVAPSNMEDAIALGVCGRDKASVLGPGTISGVDPAKFDPGKNAARGLELRRSAGVPDGAWLCGFVGRIVPHKGIETILAAWRLLPPEILANAYLCIFGGLGVPRMYALVEAAAAQANLHVKYMGFSHEMPAWYSNMTLLVQPSWHEGWGYNVLESACSGVPAIGTRISATVDAILDGKTGLLVPVKDPKTLALAIERLLIDRELRRRLGDAARERALREFSQDTISPLLLDEYHRLLNERTSTNANMQGDHNSSNVTRT